MQWSRRFVDKTYVSIYVCTKKYLRGRCFINLKRAGVVQCRRYMRKDEEKISWKHVLHEILGRPVSWNHPPPAHAPVLHNQTYLH